MKVVPAVILCIFSIAFSLRGGVYYVATDGNDSGAGTQDNPFRTIQHAVDTVQPGDTVFVREGIYREALVMKTSGTQASPIVYRTDLKKRAVITGACEVTGWQKLAGSDNVYYADVPGVPELSGWIYNRIFKEDQEELAMARIPKEGWWIAHDAGITTLTDPNNLAQFPEANDLIGSECFYESVCGCSDFIRKVLDYNPLTKQLVFDNNTIPTPGKDHYYIRNKLSLLTRPGEWALDMHRQTPRFYVRPSDDGDVNGHSYEYAAKNPVIDLKGKSYITIEGFEIRDSTLYGVYTTDSTNGLRLFNCHITGHPYIAVVLEGNDIVVENNVLYKNAYGFMMTSAKNLLVRHNHIFWGENDGLVLAYDVNNARIEDNFIHDHMLWGHPDCIQFHNGVYNVTVERNVLLNGGQSMMLADTSAGQIVNNLIVGAGGNSVIFGYNTAYPYKITGNTIALVGYSAIAATEPNGLTNPVSGGFNYDYELRDNVIFPGRSPVYSFGWKEPNIFADWNLIYQADTSQVFGSYNGYWAHNLAEWQSISSVDVHSRGQDPLFISAPEYFMVSDYPYLCTQSRLYIRENAAFIEIGDHVEAGFDGIDRIVINKGSQPYTDVHGNPITIDYIDIQPPLDKLLERNIAVADWKDREVSELDLRLQRQALGYGQDSPAIGMREDGGTVGNEVDLPALRRADFDGDGRIDDPRFRAPCNSFWGDFDRNGIINLADLTLFMSHWLQMPCRDSDWCDNYDLNRDDAVNLGDWLMVAVNWQDKYDTRISVTLRLDRRWMYQNLPGATASRLSAGLSLADPLSNSNYTYKWEIILPRDVNVAPVNLAGGGINDAFFVFAAPDCQIRGGISDSGLTHKLRVTITGRNHINQGVAEVNFGIALLGDINNDAVVDVADRAIVETFWRSGQAGIFTLADCDLNCDRQVDVADRAILEAVWRGSLGWNSVSVPCPLR